MDENKRDADGLRMQVVDTAPGYGLLCFGI